MTVISDELQRSADCSLAFDFLICYMSILYMFADCQTATFEAAFSRFGFIDNCRIGSLSAGQLPRAPERISSSAICFFFVCTVWGVQNGNAAYFISDEGNAQSYQLIRADHHTEVTKITSDFCNRLHLHLHR